MRTWVPMISQCFKPQQQAVASSHHFSVLKSLRYSPSIQIQKACLPKCRVNQMGLSHHAFRRACHSIELSPCQPQVTACSEWPRSWDLRWKFLWQRASSDLLLLVFWNTFIPLTFSRNTLPMITPMLLGPSPHSLSVCKCLLQNDY